MRAIIKREINSLFNTMTAPVFISILLCFVGVYFTAYNINAGYTYFSYTLMSSMFILMLIVPILTMRSFSEERRQKSDQILLTSPLKLHQIVLGKYFAMCAVLLIPTVLMCICPLIVKSFGSAHLGPDYASILAFYLIGCLFIAVGMYISSLTESQVIAAVSSFGALLVIYLWDGLAAMLPTSAIATTAILLLALSIACMIFWLVTKNWIAALTAEAVGIIILIVINIVKPEILQSFFVNYLSGFVVTAIFRNFAYYSLFDISGIAKILIVIAVLLFLTAQSVQKRRWS